MSRILSVLIVDDEEIVRSLFQTATVNHGRAADWRLTIAHASGPEEAIAELNDVMFQIVITDTEMGTAVDGIRLTQHVREKQPNAKVILVSSLDEEEILKRARAIGLEGHGADAFVQKRPGQWVGAFKKALDALVP